MTSDYAEILERFPGAELLELGYSADKKFRVGEDQLLRVSSMDHVVHRRHEFGAIQQLHAMGLRCSEPLEFGTFGEFCYGLFSYISGDAASLVLPGLSVEEQREVGAVSGQQLRVIHSLSVEQERLNERIVREPKFNRAEARLFELGIDFEDRPLVHEYVRKHLPLVEDRPNAFRHGDFHPGNLIVHHWRFSGVIDFNRSDEGDPYDDFYKLAFFGAPVSPAFTCELIRSYFEGSVPSDFWVLFNLYVGATLAADLVWTHTLFPHEFDRSQLRVRQIVESHDFVLGGPPAWWDGS